MKSPVEIALEALEAAGLEPKTPQTAKDAADRARLGEPLFRDLLQRGREKVHQALIDIANLFEMGGLDSRYAATAIVSILMEDYARIMATCFDTAPAQSGKMVEIAIEMERNLAAAKPN